MKKEHEIGTLYDHSNDTDGKPQRELLEFSIHSTREPEVSSRGGYRMVSVCDLDELEAGQGPSALIARGTVEDKNGQNRIEIETGFLKEWCIEYSIQEPKLWIETEHAWYRLIAPAKDYIDVHELARKRFEICARANILAVEFEPLKYADAVSFLACPYGKMKENSEADILSIRDFIVEQAANLEDKRLYQSPFVRELKKGKRSNPRPRSTPSKPSATEDLITTEALQQWVPSDEYNIEVAGLLLKRLEAVVNKLMKDKRAVMFSVPVDPVAQNCPDYLSVIKKPIDLSTVKDQLNKKSYPSVQHVLSDVRQIWANCRLYNGPESPITKTAEFLEKKFEAAVREAEQAVLENIKKRGASNGGSGALKRRRSTISVAQAAGADTDGPSESPTAPPKPKRSKTAVVDASVMAAPPLATCINPKCDNRPARPNSKYCSDDCGIQVAIARLQSMVDRGVPIPESIKVEAS